MMKNESQIHVRVPDSLKSHLEKAAKDSGRSLNAEVVQRLEASVGADAIPMNMAEFNDQYLEAAEMYVMIADDESVMKLLSKRFLNRKK